LQCLATSCCQTLPHHFLLLTTTNQDPPTAAVAAAPRKCPHGPSEGHLLSNATHARHRRHVTTVDSREPTATSPPPTRADPPSPPPTSPKRHVTANDERPPPPTSPTRHVTAAHATPPSPTIPDATSQPPRQCRRTDCTASEWPPLPSSRDVGAEIDGWERGGTRREPGGRGIGNDEGGETAREGGGSSCPLLPVFLFQKPTSRRENHTPAHSSSIIPPGCGGEFLFKRGA